MRETREMPDLDWKDQSQLSGDGRSIWDWWEESQARGGQKEAQVRCWGQRGLPGSRNLKKVSLIEEQVYP